MNRVIKILLVLISLSFCGLIQIGKAQSGGVTGASYRMGLDPIGLSMGNSISAWASNESSTLYNPALATSISDGVAIHPASTLMSFDRSLHSIQARFPLPPTAAFSLSVSQFRITGIDGRTQSGYPTGSLSSSDFRLAGAFGISLSEQFNVGMGIKWNRSDYHASVPVASTVGLDLGFLYKARPNLNLSFVVLDLFSSFSWDTGQLYGSEQGQSQSQDFARRLKISSHLYLPESINLTSEIEFRRQTFQKQEYILFSDFGETDLRLQTSDQVELAILFRQGVSWKYSDLITFRSGVETSDLRLDPELFWGSGFSLYPFGLSFSPGIHYAFRIEPGRRSTLHSLSFIFNF